MQAISLSKQRGESYLTFRDIRDGRATSWDGTNRVMFLLGGFALENAIKSFLVYENPHWISNGRLSRELRSHSLSKLQKLSRLIPYKRRYLNVLTEFEAGLESWARYPCGLSATESDPEVIMPDSVWNGYRVLMRVWKSPYGPTQATMARSPRICWKLDFLGRILIVFVTAASPRPAARAEASARR